MPTKNEKRALFWVFFAIVLFSMYPIIFWVTGELMSFFGFGESDYVSFRYLVVLVYGALIFILRKISNLIL